MARTKAQTVNGYVAELPPERREAIAALRRVILNQLRNYRDVAAEDAKLRSQVFLGMLNEGILTTPNLVGALSTVITEDEVDTYLDAFKRVFERRL